MMAPGGFAAEDAILLAFMAIAYVIAPALLARFVVKANWLQILIAFPMFWVALFLVLGFGTISQEVFGFTVIMSMFFSWLGVPLMAKLAKAANLPQRWM